MIPVDISQILDSNVVENDRIELKKSWNPELILHTICAFANDIDNCGGGYIVIGIEEKNGMPEGYVGVKSSEVDGYNKKLVELCNKIYPRYLVESEYVEYKGVGLFVIWVPGGRERPYKCAKSLSEKRSDNAYYIRKLSSTVIANDSEEKELFQVSNNTPFDDRICSKGGIRDIKTPLLKDFLETIGSKLAKEVMEKPKEDILEQMHLMSGPDENRMPINVAHLFFNDHPEDIFPNCVIEVVYKPDPTGIGMEERIFRGPLDRQIIDSVRFVSNSYLSEKIIKNGDRPESLRVWNYPLQAVEEAISNAVYHKDYQVHEPITITVMNDRIEITSVPGPFRSISDEDLKQCRMVSRLYRNRRIGEYLKELGLAEGRNTGVPTMVSLMQENGSELPRFETDSERSYLTVVLPINKVFLKEDVKQTNTPSGRRTQEQIRKEIVMHLAEREYNLKELGEIMGYNGPSTSLKNAVNLLISEGTVEYTSKSLRSPKQSLKLRHRD